MKIIMVVLNLVFVLQLSATIINIPVDQPTIQDGISSATLLDTVLVQPGTYYGLIDYEGKSITVASLYLTTQDTSYISSTILENGDGYMVVRFNDNENYSAELHGFTITNGGTLSGGGISCWDSSPTLKNLIVSGNSAYTGGGISCNNSSPTIFNVIIKNNTSTNNGGGLYCENNSNPFVENVLIFNNITNSAGGGICCDNSSPSFEDVTISGNSASFGGGIAINNYSHPNFNKVIITDNIAGGWGGGIEFQGDFNSILQNMTITGNSASDGGGIHCISVTNMILNNVILWNNSPEEIDIYNTTITISYSTIQGGETGIISDSSTINWLTGNLESNPVFADPLNQNYNLQFFSPCIDAGDPLLALDLDGTISDIGANYFHQHFGPLWHISTTGSFTTGNGSEQNPFASVEYGIIASSNNDTILVQPGHYWENFGFQGKSIVVGSLFLTTSDTSYISSTIIDGDAAGSTVFFNSDEDSTSVLCGVTITNGFDSYGGGISCTNSSPRLHNLKVSNNHAESSGGGINCYDGANPIIENVQIVNNSAVDYGGGLYCGLNSSPTLNEVTISNNSANHGGGINCYSNSSPELQYVLLSDNIVVYDGGGIYCNDHSNPVLQNVTITNNTANGNGGGIYCSSYDSPILTNTIMWNDSPNEIIINSGSVSATYSDIQGGFTGTGNINDNPSFTEFYFLQSGSPCIDTGDPSSSYDPDGTRADMGAYYHHQIISLDPPQNLMITITTIDVQLAWDEVTEANYYIVFSSDDPNTGFIEDTSGTFDGESWSSALVNEKKFYYVKAIQ